MEPNKLFDINEILSCIDNLIDEWHDSPNITVSLQDYLGMTWKEYVEFTTNPSIVLNFSTERIKSFMDRVSSKKVSL
jgi:hypothetical protein